MRRHHADALLAARGGLALCPSGPTGWLRGGDRGELVTRSLLALSLVWRNGDPSPHVVFTGGNWVIVHRLTED